MTKVTFAINMRFTAECDGLVEVYIKEAKQAIKKGLIEDLKRLPGVIVEEVKVESKF